VYGQTDRQTDNLTFSKLSSPGRDRVRGAQFPTGARVGRANGRTDDASARAVRRAKGRTIGRSKQEEVSGGRTDGRTRVDRFLDLDLDCVALTPLRRRRRHVSSIERADKTGAGL